MDGHACLLAKEIICPLKQLDNFVSRQLYFLNRKTVAQSPKPQEADEYMIKMLPKRGWEVRWKDLTKC